MDQPTASTPATTPPRKKWFSRFLLFFLLVLLGVQFIQPGKNNQSMDMTNDISQVVPVPDTVHSLLKIACYDCHSNYTNYPWYSNIQPAGWWLKNHVDEGKQKLNFQEFALLKPRPNSKYKTTAAQQAHKLDEVRESQTDKWMPLESYTFIHKEARLTDAQRQLIINWVDSALVKLNN